MSLFGFKNTPRKKMRRSLFFVGTALVVLAVIAHGLSRELTTAGYIVSILVTLLVVSALAAATLFPQVPEWLRFVAIPLATVFCIASGISAFGPIVKPMEPLSRSEKIAQTKYSELTLIGSDCSTGKGRSGRRTPIDMSIQTRLNECMITIDTRVTAVTAWPFLDSRFRIVQTDDRKTVTITIPKNYAFGVYLTDLTVPEDQLLPFFSQEDLSEYKPAALSY